MSKELEALKCLEKVNDYLNNVYDYKEIKEEVRKDIDNIKQALLKAQEQECKAKLFNIIKDKNLLIDTVHNQIFRYSEDYSSYCKLFKMYRLNEKNLLNKEEFDILKKEGF